MESLLELQLPNDNKKNNDNTIIIPRFQFRMFHNLCFKLILIRYRNQKS